MCKNVFASLALAVLFASPAFALPFHGQNPVMNCVSKLENCLKPCKYVYAPEYYRSCAQRCVASYNQCLKDNWEPYPNFYGPSEEMFSRAIQAD